LVIASKLSQFDLDITVFGHPHGYVPEGQVYIEADKRLRELAKEIADRKDIKLFEGIIATGDQFVSSDNTKEFIYDIFKADA